MKTNYEIKELPLAEMERLGLYDGKGKFNLDPEDMDALLAGRRTNLVTFRELDANGFRIERLDAKISFYRETDGKVGFKLHPIYKAPVIPDQLNESDAADLISGKLAHANITLPGTGKESIVFEYDPETREFIAYDPDRVLVPEKINGFKLKDWQKDDFKKGLIIDLPDGTQLHHKATERKGILSDRTALILSVLLDGGISYIILRGLKNIFSNVKQQKQELSEAFNRTLEEVERKLTPAAQSQQDILQQEVNHQVQRNSGYGRGQAR